MKRVILRPFVMPFLLISCTLFYYFGELVDWATWDALRKEFFYSVHDIHRILFLIPIIYASYTARVKGTIIITLVSFIIFLPRAFFISPFPDPLLRMMLFTLGAGVIGYLVARLRNEEEKSQRLEVLITTERDKLLEIINGMADGVIITGPDYRIRFMNASMVNSFGEGTGIPCYKHLHNLDAPCHPECRIPDVIKYNEIRKWECSIPDGKTYEVVASPYVGTGGEVCKLSIFRDVTKRQNNQA